MSLSCVIVGAKILGPRDLLYSLSRRLVCGFVCEVVVPNSKKCWNSLPPPLALKAPSLNLGWAVRTWVIGWMSQRNSRLVILITFLQPFPKWNGFLVSSSLMVGLCPILVCCYFLVSWYQCFFEKNCFLIFDLRIKWSHMMISQCLSAYLKSNPTRNPATK